MVYVPKELGLEFSTKLVGVTRKSDTVVHFGNLCVMEESLGFPLYGPMDYIISKLEDMINQEIVGEVDIRYV